MTYKLVRAPNLKTLEFYTQEECLKGWRPTGGPTYSQQTTEWAQAVWRDTPPLALDKLNLKEPRSPLDCQGVPLGAGIGKAKTREK